MNIDTNILRFCKENNLSDDTYQKIRYFLYSMIADPFYQTTPMDSSEPLISFDNSEMETDKDTYYYLSYESDRNRIYLYHSNRRGNLKLNYLSIIYDVSYSILIILQSIFPEIQINDRYQIRGEMNQKIVHHLFYLIESFRSPNCFDAFIQKRKALKLSEKRELATKFNNQCDCCGTILGDITRSSNEDHIRELQYFGTNKLDNFQLLCLDCHNCKTKLNKSKKRKMEDTNPTQSKRQKQH